MANFDLREKIGALITGDLRRHGNRVLKHISDIVTAHAKEQLRERSWLIGQGWEADPKSIPVIETLIGEGRGAVRNYVRPESTRTPILTGAFHDLI